MRWFYLLCALPRLASEAKCQPSLTIFLVSEGWFVRQVSSADVGSNLFSDWSRHWTQQDDQQLRGQEQGEQQQEQEHHQHQSSDSCEWEQQQQCEASPIQTIWAQLRSSDSQVCGEQENEWIQQHQVNISSQHWHQVRHHLWLWHNVAFLCFRSPRDVVDANGNKSVSPKHSTSSARYSDDVDVLNVKSLVQW